MLFTGTEIVCPAGDPGTPPLVINLGKILAAERRQEEVATVTAFKAPELLTTYNRSWLDLSEVLARLTLEKAKAEKAMLRRRSILILEVVSGVLTAKKLASNEANREAVIQTDPEFERISDTVDQIKAVMKYLEGKLQSFENAFTSVKKVLGTDQPYMRPASNGRLSGDATPSPSAGSMTEPEKPAPPRVSGFGKPRY